MGFDLNIIINISIDEVTGLPYILKLNPMTKKPYNPEEYKIPEEFRKWIDQRGHHFHAYIKNFDDSTLQCDVEIFLHYYPKWEDVKYDILDNDDWNEKDHNEFKKCLEWLESKPGVFGIRWSY
jgi:hypothetical protein